MHKSALFVIVAIVYLMACVPGTKHDNSQQITGTVKLIGLEGGFYGIIADSGQRLDPPNLPDEFKQDGLRVIFSGHAREDQASFHMWGTLIEITHIEKLDNSRH